MGFSYIIPLHYQANGKSMWYFGFSTYQMEEEPCKAPALDTLMPRYMIFDKILFPRGSFMKHNVVKAMKCSS